MEIYSKDSMGMFNEKKHINILSDNLRRDFCNHKYYNTCDKWNFNYSNMIMTTDYEKSSFASGRVCQVPIKGLSVQTA